MCADQIIAGAFSIPNDPFTRVKKRQVTFQMTIFLEGFHCVAFVQISDRRMGGCGDVTDCNRDFIEWC